LKCFLFTFRAN